MPKWTKFLCLALCVLSTLFCAIGYASITGTMTIRGNVELDPPPIYISEVILVSSGGENLNSSQTAETVMTSQISLADDANSYAVLAVTVKNTTEDTYGYNATIRTAGINDVTYSNGDIVYAVYQDAACTNYLARGTELAPKVGNEPGEITFYVKFYYADKADIDSGGETLNSVLNFQFLTPPPENTDSTGTAVNGALDQFENILDNSETFTTLTTEINKNYDGSRAWTGTFIGNVAGSEEFGDNAVMNDLFANKLHLNIDGQDVALTAIVKWEDVDGDPDTGQTYTVGTGDNKKEYKGAEMTLYLTNDALTGTQTSQPVYAVVYTKDAGSDEWYQLGEIYTGGASVVGYFGGYSGGSFDTGSWRSRENYYGVYSGATIQAIIQQTTYDIAELQALADQAHALHEIDYTAESWAPLQTALDHADAAISNYWNMTQSKIETLERQLKEAIQGLVSQTGS